MIENNPGNVSSAFEMLLEEAEAEIDFFTRMLGATVVWDEEAAGARNVPLATLDGAKGLPTNKALPLVLVCASGARSSRAAAELRKAGYASVHSLSGGTEAWRNASLPIEKSA